MAREDTGGASEGLTGQVHNNQASDIEERFARALYKLDIPFQFRVVFFGNPGMPGSIEVDFLCNDLVLQPVQIDGEFTHKSAAQKARDKRRDDRIDQYLMRQGAYPTVRVPGIDLQTQDDADKVAREIFR